MNHNNLEYVMTTRTYRDVYYTGQYPKSAEGVGCGLCDGVNCEPGGCCRRIVNEIVEDADTGEIISTTRVSSELLAPPDYSCRRCGEDECVCEPCNECGELDCTCPKCPTCGYNMLPRWPSEDVRSTDVLHEGERWYCISQENHDYDAQRRKEREGAEYW